MTPISQPPPLPPRPADGHKGMFGRVLVVGGNEGMIGAPVMAGTSALRLGAGLVQVAVPRSILSAALSITPELIGLGLGKAAGKDQLLEAAEKADAELHQVTALLKTEALQDAIVTSANFSSIAIQIGGIGALAPERRHDLARLGMKSMIAGLLACYLFAAVVGVII